MLIAPLITYHRRDRQAEERRLRTGILRIGTLLGWHAPTVAHFAAAVTDHPLSGTGCAELLRVLEADATIARRVRTAQARQERAPDPEAGTP